MVGYRSASRAYCPNNHLTLSVRSVDRSALGRALARVVQRHEVLRTVFDERGATAVAEAVPSIEFADASGSSADPIERARRLAVETVLPPFAYDRDVLCRAALIRVSADEDLLVVVVPHVVADLASMYRLRQELVACYASETGAGAPPPPVALQYGDFVDWQRQWLDRDARADLLRYYEARIAGASAPTAHRRSIPADRRTWKGASVPIRLSDSAAGAVQAVSWRARVTPVVLLLAIYQIAIRHWSGCDDALIAMPFAGRRGAEMAGLIGLFSCQALVRSSVSGDPTFRELLARVGASAKEAYANEGTPYGALAEIARERGDPDPPMTFCLNVDPKDDDTGENGPFRSTRVSLEAYGGYRLTRFDLNLLIRQLSKASVVGELRYCADVLDEPTARRYAHEFLALVAAATSDPGLRVSAIVDAACAAVAAEDAHGANVPARENLGSVSS
jgi:hypothetical protein